MPDAQSVQTVCMFVQCVDTYRILLQQMLWLLRESVLTDFKSEGKNTQLSMPGDVQLSMLTNPCTLDRQSLTTR